MCGTWTVRSLQDRETTARDRDNMADRASVHRPLQSFQSMVKLHIEDKNVVTLNVISLQSTDTGGFICKSYR